MSLGIEVAAADDDIVDSPVFFSGERVEWVASRLRNRVGAEQHQRKDTKRDATKLSEQGVLLEKGVS